MKANVADHIRYRRLHEVGRRLHRRGAWRCALVVQWLFRWVYSADVPVSLDLRNVVLMHNALGTVLHPDVVFRGRATVFQHVTIGLTGHRRDTNAQLAPSIGDRVFIGCGAVILGPIWIGDDCIIGAGAVVTRDVASGHRIVGNPGVAAPLASTEFIETWFDGS